MANIRAKWLLINLGVSAALMGCSTTKTVSVITETSNWTVGQHDYCVFKANKLLCVPQGNARINAPTDLLREYKQGQQAKVEDLLFVNSIGFMSDVEEQLREPEDERKIQVSIFDTKFSEKPNDYSIWNCMSTGKGSPAVDCMVMKQPDSKDKELIARKLHEQELQDKALAVLARLSHKTIEEHCGSPLQRAESEIGLTELYKGESALLAFYFETWPKPKDELGIASSLDAPPAKLNHDAVLKGKHYWYGRSKTEASWYLEQMPCLNK